MELKIIQPIKFGFDNVKISKRIQEILYQQEFERLNNLNNNEIF